MVSVSRLRRIFLHLLRLLLLGVIPIIAAFLSLQYYAHGGRFVETENAYVKANIISVSAQIAGRVMEVSVSDNQFVAAGAPLFRINPQPYEIAIERGRARLDVIRTEVASLRAEYRATLLQADETRERIKFLQRQLERQEKLKKYGMISGNVYDEARLNLDVAHRQLATVEESANRVLANLSGNAHLAPAKHPRFAEAKTVLDEAMMDLERTRITAPAAGVVSNMKLRVGEYADQGAPLFSLIESGQPWIEANFKETQLTNIRVGQAAMVVSDIYPDQSWRAVVSTIAPATGAEFAVLPPQNATGNWVKVVQRVPVLIHVEPGHTNLRVGMTVSVSVDTKRERGLPRSIQRLVDAGWLPRFLQPKPALAGNEP
ncbi:MAG: HlyD family secretion protein [Pseudomonadota bacterium]|nr:HlyD family secretion protein [Pseudomonadota bacterium]